MDKFLKLLKIITTNRFVFLPATETEQFLLRKSLRKKEKEKIIAALDSKWDVEIIFLRLKMCTFESCVIMCGLLGKYRILILSRKMNLKI